MFFSKNYGIKSKIYAAFLTLLEQKFLLLLRKKKKKKKDGSKKYYFGRFVGIIYIGITGSI